VKVAKMLMWRMQNRKKVAKLLVFLHLSTSSIKYCEPTKRKTICFNQFDINRCIYIQGVPKYLTHFFMALYLLMAVDWGTGTAFILTPICVAWEWVVRGLWRCWGTGVVVKSNWRNRIENTKVWKLRADLKVCNQGWPLQISNNQW